MIPQYNWRIAALSITWCLSMMLVSTASAQPPSQPEAEVQIEIEPVLINDVESAKTALHPLRPFIEPSTFAVGDLALTAIDSPSMTAWIKKNFGALTQGAPIDLVSTLIQGNLQQLRDSGADHVYVLVSTRIAGDQAPVVVIPCRDTAKVKTLVQAVVNSIPNANLAFESTDRAVLLGPERALARIRSKEVKEAETISAHTDRLLSQLVEPSALPHRIVLQLPREVREELTAFWPDAMPANSPVKLSPRQTVVDLSSLTVSWQLPPELAVRVKLEAADNAEARDRLDSILREAVALIPEGSQDVKLTTNENTIILDADTPTMINMVKQLVRPWQENAWRQRSMSSAKQILLAMHLYNAEHKHFPAPAITDKSGQPLLSWRVAILPHIEQTALYDQFRLDEPWDSPHNAKLISKMPAIYASGDMQTEAGKTRFRLPRIAGGAWDARDTPLTVKSITDGTSVTIALVEAPHNQATEWTRPETFDLEGADATARFFGDEKQIVAARFDGSVSVISERELPAENLRALLTFAGKEAIP